MLGEAAALLSDPDQDKRVQKQMGGWYKLVWSSKDLRERHIEAFRCQRNKESVLLKAVPEALQTLVLVF